MKLTPLEFVIMKNPYNKEGIRFLCNITEKTSLILANSRIQFKKFYETEDYSQYDIERINRLIECGLIDFEPTIAKYIKPIICSKSIKELFEQGCWIRSIERENEEKQNLDLADRGVDRERSVTFIAYGIPIRTFGCGRPSLLIRSKNRIISYWYDGQYGEEMTDLGNGICLKQDGFGHYKNILEKDILMMLKKLHKDTVDYYKHAPMDQCGVLFVKKCQKISFAWNEAFLCYNRGDVLGICVDYRNKKYCRDAISLRNNLGLNSVPFYYYDDRSSSLLDITEAMQYVFTNASHHLLEQYIMQNIEVHTKENYQETAIISALSSAN